MLADACLRRTVLPLGRKTTPLTVLIYLSVCVDIPGAVHVQPWKTPRSGEKHRCPDTLPGRVRTGGSLSRLRTAPPCHTQTQPLLRGGCGMSAHPRVGLYAPVRRPARRGCRKSAVLRARPRGRSGRHPPVRRRRRRRRPGRSRGAGPPAAAGPRRLSGRAQSQECRRPRLPPWERAGVGASGFSCCALDPRPRGERRPRVDPGVPVGSG
jgi:hypothetical protein